MAKCRRRYGPSFFLAAFRAYPSSSLSPVDKLYPFRREGVSAYRVSAAFENAFAVLCVVPVFCQISRLLSAFGSTAYEAASAVYYGNGRAKLSRMIQVLTNEISVRDVF